MIIIAEKLIVRAGRQLRKGALVIRSGKILDVGQAERMVEKYPRHRVMHLDSAVLMPGLVNAHTHVELPSLYNRVQGTDYAEWVLNLLKAKAHLTDRDYSSAVHANISSIILSGTTTLGEICTHGISLPILSRSGLRAAVFHEVISMAQEPGKVVLPRIDRSHRLMRQGLSPHSPHTVSEAVLETVRRYALKRRLPISMHVAETGDEVRLLRGRPSGLERLYAAARWDRAWAPRARSSFEYLRRTGILGPSFLAVHAVHADAADISLIKRSGASIAHCPRSNRALGVGRMRLAEFLRAGIPVGLGTDSLASVPSLSLWDEMRYAFRLHRTSGITAENIFAIATLGGATALGMAAHIGSLEPGKRADCIAVPLPARDTGDLYSDLLRETESCMMSMVDGKIIYHQRRKQRT